MSSRDFGTEVLRVEQAEDVERLDEWIHDAYVEDALEFDAEAQRAVIPFAQESANLSDPLGPEWLEETMVEITSLGGYPVLVIMVAAVVGFLLVSRQAGPRPSSPRRRQRRRACECERRDGSRCR